MREVSCGIFAGYEEPEGGKLKNLHYQNPLPGSD
jgi:hypothetical protein